MPNRHSSDAQRRRFDAQAAVYDQRAGLPAEAVSSVAGQLLDLLPGPRPAALLELAAGTGELGYALAQGCHYTALEQSPAMLAQFQQRLEHAASVTPSKPTPQLIQADGNQPWPLADTCQDAVFIARAAHLFSSTHLQEEIRRITRPGAVLILGRVNKAADAVATHLRQRLQQLLIQHGYQPRRGGRSHRALAALFDAQPQHLSAARWQISESPAEVIGRWRAKPGLGGEMLASEQQASILDQLEVEATQDYPDLHQTIRSQREYELTIAQIHPPHR